MKTLIVGDDELTVIQERGRGDGGLVINYFVKEADGTFSNFRHWFSDPAQGRSYASRLSDQDIDVLVQRARRNEVAEN